MKHLLLPTLVVGALFFSTQINAQKKNETTAAVAFKNNYLPAIASNNFEAAQKALIEAKEAIDLAAVHAETENSPKTLWLKGEIYSRFSELAMKSNDTSILNLAGPNSLNVSAAAFKKGFDVSDKYDRDIEESVGFVNYIVNSAANVFYKTENFLGAAEMYTYQTLFSDAVGVIDTSSIFNAAICFEKAESFDEAAQKYTICADYGYKGALSYAYASNCYRKISKVEKAKEIVAKGRLKYPTDKELILQLVNIHLELNDIPGAEKALQEAIAADPKNKALHYTIGSVYLDLKKYDQAEKALNDALSIDPNYLDALYQSGALLVTWGGEIMSEANDLKPGDSRFDSMDKQAKEIYNRAIVHLEKYDTLSPNDKSVLTILSKLYRSVGNMTKYKEAKAKAESL
jgi:tetratricopeptide (TPR) repeat protein